MPYYDYKPVKQPGAAFVARVAELLAYDPHENEVFWKRPRNGTKSPKGGWPPAGGLRPDGVHVTRVDGKQYQTHYLAYAIQAGRWPRGRIKFFDGNKLNWRLSNMCDTDWRNEMTHEQLIARGYKYPGETDPAIGELAHLENEARNAVLLTPSSIIGDPKARAALTALENENAHLFEHERRKLWKDLHAKLYEQARVEAERKIVTWLRATNRSTDDPWGQAHAYFDPQFAQGELVFALFHLNETKPGQQMEDVRRAWASRFPGIDCPATLGEAVETFHLLTKGPMS